MSTLAPIYQNRLQRIQTFCSIAADIAEDLREARANAAENYSEARQKNTIPPIDDALEALDPFVALNKADNFAVAYFHSDSLPLSGPPAGNLQSLVRSAYAVPETLAANADDPVWDYLSEVKHKYTEFVQARRKAAECATYALNAQIRSSFDVNA